MRGNIYWDFFFLTESKTRCVAGDSGKSMKRTGGLIKFHQGSNFHHVSGLLRRASLKLNQLVVRSVAVSGWKSVGRSLRRISSLISFHQGCNLCQVNGKASKKSTVDLLYSKAMHFF